MEMVGVDGAVTGLPRTPSSSTGTTSASDPSVSARFPSTFFWGAATSAYQIEGAVAEDGRRPSIWDRFVKVPGAVRDGDNGDVAADHYHRYAEDVGLMTALGLKAYHFSVAWPRVIPEGRGSVNRKGLDFYKRLVDALLRNDIEPFLTLYHWDLPQGLQERGGWADRDTADAFAAYAGVMVDALGDTVRHWSTLNEPWCSAFLGHASGVHAPGITNPKTAYLAAHHLLLGHGAAARRLSGRDREVSVILNLFPVHPASPRQADIDAAQVIDGLQNRMFLDAVLNGLYPSDVLEIIDRCAGLAHVRDGDLELISTPLGALGVNYYRSLKVAAAPGRGEPAEFPGVGGVQFVHAVRTTSMGWGIDPNGLHELLVRLKMEYPRIPLYVTENGAAFPDDPNNGHVHDPERVAFLRQHVEAARRAIADGVDLRGYFVWSLLDNFEWAQGYSKRFGIVWVDFHNQKRILKESAHWYRDLIVSNGDRGAG